MESVLKPDYSYVKGKERFNKEKYTVSYFKNNDAFLYEEKKTAKELALLNKMYKIYDAGRTKWIKKF